MKSNWKWMVLGVAAVSCSLAGCEDRTGVEVEPPAAPGQLSTVVGVVMDVEPNEIQIRTQDAGVMEFELNEEVGIYENGVRINATALQEGAEVRATFSAVGDDKSLTRLEVTPLADEGSPLLE